MLQSHSPVTKPSSFYGVTFRSVGPYHRLQSIFLALRSRLECVRTFRSRQSDYKKLVAKGEIMFKVKQLGVAAAITLFAGAAMASNFRAADQVYVPAAGHISSSSATFVSDIFISNLSDDSVDVSVILATGTGGTQISFPRVVTLAPRGFTLQPLGSTQTGVGSASLFPSFTKGPTSTGAYAVFQQSGTVPTADANLNGNGCPNGCPAFFAFGSVLDNQTNDPTTLE